MHGEAGAGVAYGLAAYLWWGVVPIYYKQVAQVSPLEVVAHRVIWSLVLLSVLMRLYGRWRVAVDLLKAKLTIFTLCATTILIAVNWLTFIWAIANDLILQASLGYFINPLLNVLLGFMFLGERLRRWQTVSVILAGIGVAYLTLSYGELPWPALVMAGTFGLYGLLRKTAKVDALVGLTVETMLLTPLALGYVIYLVLRGECVFGTESRQMDVLLVLGGVITAVPLLWFTNAARRLRLATLGFLQYVAPTLHFLLAVAVYGEAFTPAHQIAFACIWTALIIYSIDTVRWSKAQAAGRRPPSPTNR